MNHFAKCIRAPTVRNSTWGSIVTDQDCITHCVPLRAEWATYQDYRAHWIAAWFFFSIVKPSSENKYCVVKDHFEFDLLYAEVSRPQTQEGGIVGLWRRPHNDKVIEKSLIHQHSDCGEMCIPQTSQDGPIYMHSGCGFLWCYRLPQKYLWRRYGDCQCIWPAWCTRGVSMCVLQGHQL